MTAEERKIWLKELISKPGKTIQDYEKLGKGYERHMQLLKEEAEKRREEIQKDLDVFTTSLV